MENKELTLINALIQENDSDIKNQNNTGFDIETQALWVKYLDFKKEILDDIKQAIIRLNEYEEVLGGGRLTDRNYKNTTLDLESCKPYLRLGQLEDIYEKNKKGK